MKIFEVLVAAMIVLLIVAVILALPTMLLWNWLMPIIFHLPEITFWQALGLNILAGILFRSSSQTK